MRHSLQSQTKENIMSTTITASVIDAMTPNLLVVNDEENKDELYLRFLVKWGSPKASGS